MAARRRDARPMTTHEVIEAEVLIVGGGMVGLSLGCALAGAGVEVALLDRADPAAQPMHSIDGA